MSNSSCALNQFCNELALGGQCCPTVEALTLDCCGTPVIQECNLNEGCAALGLVGKC